jgi:hypothetical protein
MNSLEELKTGIERTHPNLIDRWEAAAVVESLGYNDRRVSESFGVPSTLTLGTLLFRSQQLQPMAPAPVPQDATEDTTLPKAAMSSLVYTMPWLLVFVAESWNPALLHLSPSFAAPLTLALLASLVVSGGFVQAIARRAQFCIGIAQTGLAQSTCLHLMLAGLGTALAVAVASVIVGWHYSLFSVRFLVLAALYFVVATALWMHCAVLGVGRQIWRIPLVFAAGAAAFTIIRLQGAETLVAQIAAVTAALMCAAFQSRQVFGRNDTTMPGVGTRVNPWIVAHGLAPYFLYGALYFTFLVADRVAAGAAVASRGQSFGVPQGYKDGMDVALLTFLVASAAVECCSVLLMRQWRAAGQLPYDGRAVPGFARLIGQRRVLTSLLVAVFAAIAFFVHQIAEPLTQRSIEGLAGTILLVGDAGYLLFAVGLFNALALLAVNRVSRAARALAAAVIVNLVAGTLLGHLLGAYYAAAGITAGGAVFAVLTSRELSRTIENADEAYAGA